MYAIAVFQNRIKGTVKFYQSSPFNSVHVMFDLYNLEPNSTHAIHIHEYGDISDTDSCCGNCGGHWNPHNRNHGSIWNPCQERHAGDLINNLHADENGRFKFEYWDPLLTLSGLDTIYGLSIVIHSGTDDLGLGCNPESLKNGNAGKRIACSVIGKSKPFPKQN